MKTLSEKQALEKLRGLKNDFRSLIQNSYEHRAKNCLTCEVQGSCCTDAHFVNVHITRLEAVLIDAELQKFPPARQKEIKKRIGETIEKYALDTDGDTFQKTFACPLFEKGAGCLVHTVKPVACIQHACYERREDLPPDELQIETETKIEKLNRHVYRKFPCWLPLPVFLKLLEGDQKT